MKKALYLLIALTALTYQAQSQVTEIDPTEDNVPGKSEKQDREKRNIADSKWVFGGGLGASFGQFTNVMLAPMVGYRVTPKFTPGIGFNYQYVRLKEPPGFNFFLDYTLNTVGPSVFMQYDLFYGVFLHSEFATQWYNFKYTESPFFTASGNEQALFLGGGYRFGGSSGGGLQIIALYNVLYKDTNFVYWRPWNIRFALMF